MLKFNHIKRETLPQTRIDVRPLEMVRGYPLYVKEHTDREPPIGEVLEQYIINTLSGDADFVEWLSRQPRAELESEQSDDSTPAQRGIYSRVMSSSLGIRTNGRPHVKK